MLEFLAKHGSKTRGNQNFFFEIPLKRVFFSKRKYFFLKMPGQLFSPFDEDKNLHVGFGKNSLYTYSGFPSLRFFV